LAGVDARRSSEVKPSRERSADSSGPRSRPEERAREAPGTRPERREERAAGIDRGRDENRPAPAAAGRDEARELQSLAQRWKGMEARLDKLQGRKDGPARAEVVREMRGVASRIRENPKLREEFVRQQSDLGVRRASSLDRAVRERDLDRSLERMRDRENDRGR